MSTLNKLLNTRVGEIKVKFFLVSLIFGVINGLVYRHIRSPWSLFPWGNNWLLLALFTVTLLVNLGEIFWEEVPYISIPIMAVLAIYSFLAISKTNSVWIGGLTALWGISFGSVGIGDGIVGVLMAFVSPLSVISGGLTIIIARRFLKETEVPVAMIIVTGATIGGILW